MRRRASADRYGSGGRVWVAVVVAAVSSLAMAADLSVGPNTPIDPRDRPRDVPLRPPLSGPADWPTFRGNMRRTGSFGEGLLRNVRLVWAFQDPDFPQADFSSSPAIAGGRVYVGSGNPGVFQRSGKVHCLDLATGRALWAYATAQEVFSSPSVAGGRVYVGEGLHQDSDSKMRCLDAATGRLIWEYRVEGHAESPPTVVGDRVVFGGGDGGLYCVEASSGKPVWRLTGYHIDIAPAVSAGRVFAGSGYGKRCLVAADLQTGKRLWEKEMEASVWGDPAVVGERIFLGTSNATVGGEPAEAIGVVHCLDVDTGNEVWRFRAKDGIGASLAVDGNDVFCGSWDHHVYCLDRETGTKRWGANLGAVVYASPAIGADRLYAATNDGQVVCLARRDGQVLWSNTLRRWLPGGTQILASPALVGDRLYVGTTSNRFFCFEDTE